MKNNRTKIDNKWKDLFDYGKKICKKMGIKSEEEIYKIIKRPEN